MAKRFKVGDSVVGKLISTMGKKATVLEVIVNGRRRKYVVRWETGKVSMVSTNGICLARDFEPKAKCSRRKRARALEETEEASTLPASRFELDSSSVANAEGVANIDTECIVSTLSSESDSNSDVEHEQR